MERSIDNEKRGLGWFDRDDTHCFHGNKCCWCGGITEFPMRDGPHGPHTPKTRKRKKAAPVAPIEAEPVDGGAARMRKEPTARRSVKHDDGHDYENTFFDLYEDEPW